MTLYSHGASELAAAERRRHYATDQEQCPPVSGRCGRVALEADDGGVIGVGWRVQSDVRDPTGLTGRHLLVGHPTNATDIALDH
jgi:hypothetical protein